METARVRVREGKGVTGSDGDRAKHNAPKGRYGYRPTRIPVTRAGYDIELDRCGRAYAWQGGTVRRCDVLPTRAGFAISGPDGKQFLVFRSKDGAWIFRDLETVHDIEIGSGA